MCGIAGIFAYDNSAPPVERHELRKIRDHMVSRGPDGKGEWYSQDKRVGLAHRRLAIIDLSDNAAQPMVSEDGKLVISFNGEIYNYRELRQDLERKGYQFRSQSDTEVLIHLYAEKGADMVHELRGMFAIVIWDEDRQELFLTRDPYGIKPLYYSDDRQTVRVASQVKALLAGGNISVEKDPAGVVGFFLFGSVPEPYTTYSQISAVPAGSVVYVTSYGAQAPSQYNSFKDIWIAAEQTNEVVDDIQELVREALMDSVKHHMVSDVPVGAFLSAGVDSGALLGLMSQTNPDTPIQTVTLAFQEFKGRHEDESALAEQVAKQYGAKHICRIITENEFQSDLPKILEAMDQPSIDGINTWFVSKATAELGLKVAISGLGGDELFGGYPSFRNIPRWVNYFRIPSRIPFLGDIVRKTGSFLLPSNTLLNPKAMGLVKYGGTYPGAYLLCRGLFMPWELDRFLDPIFVDEGLKKLRPVEHVRKVLDQRLKKSFSRIAVMESSLYMRNQLLRDTDWAGMAHSLEVRVPLVDLVLLKRLAPILITKKKIGGKYFLGKSPNPALPDSVLTREKTGFSTPINYWMKRENRFCKQNRLESGATNHWSRDWACDVFQQ